MAKEKIILRETNGSFLETCLELDREEEGGENSLCGYVHIGVSNLTQPKKMKQFYHELIDYCIKEEGQKDRGKA